MDVFAIPRLALVVMVGEINDTNEGTVGLGKLGVPTAEQKGQCNSFHQWRDVFVFQC